MNSVQTFAGHTGARAPDFYASAVAHEYDLAPADRYFGRRRLSVLELRYALDEMSVRLDALPEEAELVVIEAAFVADALRDWAQAFPNDPALPRYAYELVELYRAAGTPEAHDYGDLTLDWLASTFLTVDVAHAKSAQ